MKPKIFITRRIPLVAKELLSPYFDVEMNSENSPLSRDKLKEIVRDYEGILSTVTERFDEDTLNNAQKLKVISNYAVGLDNINLKLAAEKGIAIYNTPDVVTYSTADMTLSLLLSLIRKIDLAQRFVHENKWKCWDPELFLGEELHGKTFGIIGLGKIGKEVAKRAYGFGLNVVYFTRTPTKFDEEYYNTKIKAVDLDTLLKQSDYISIHLPLTEETKHLIGSDAFSKMNNKPIILNLSRGGIVDTGSLIYALENGQIKGACLDVTNPEPLPENHPLLKYPNCIITPHIGTATTECRINMATLAAKNLINHFRS